MLPEIKRIRKYKEKFIRSVDRFGTPQYILVVNELKKRIKLINQFKKRYPSMDIYYHYKTNCLPFICKLMHKSNIYADVSSLFELKLALKLKAKKIIFNGPGKTRKELNLAISNSDKVIINVDNYEELKEIIKISREKRKKVSIGLRLYIKSNDIGWSKFGIKPEKINNILKFLEKEKNIDFQGFHFHIGTEIKNPSIYKNTLKKLRKVINNLNDEERKKIKFINVGGGFGVDGYYRYNIINKIFNRESKLYRNKPIDEFIKTITDSFKKYILSIENINSPTLILEPGRWLVSPCMYLLTRVLYKKGDSVILDSGINICMPLLYEYHPMINLSSISNERKKCILFGSALLHVGILGKYYYGDVLEKNDILCIINMGAYMETLSWQFSKPLSRIIALSDNKIKEIKKEEDFDYRFGRDI